MRSLKLAFWCMVHFSVRMPLEKNRLHTVSIKTSEALVNSDTVSLMSNIILKRCRSLYADIPAIRFTHRTTDPYFKHSDPSYWPNYCHDHTLFPAAYACTRTQPVYYYDLANPNCYRQPAFCIVIQDVVVDGDVRRFYKINRNVRL